MQSWVIKYRIGLYLEEQVWVGPPKKAASWARNSNPKFPAKPRGAPVEFTRLWRSNDSHMTTGRDLRAGATERVAWLP